MSQADVRIANPLGLHSRAAGRFVRLASTFESVILVQHGDTTANGKSILGLLSLAASRGTTLRLRAEGEDAEAAIEALCKLIREDNE